MRLAQNLDVGLVVLVTTILESDDVVQFGPWPVAADRGFTYQGLTHHAAPQ
jgi:hypothetical protein